MAKEEYVNLLYKVGPQMNGMRHLFTDKQMNDPTKFNSWGIKSDTQFFTLYLQNKLQARNHARRDAISLRNYKDPWYEDQDYVQNQYGKLIEEEKSKQIS